MAVEPHDTMSHESILIGRLASGSCAFVKSVYVCLRLRVSSWSWPYRPAAGTDRLHRSVVDRVQLTVPGDAVEQVDPSLPPRLPDPEDMRSPWVSGSPHTVEDF